MFRNFGQTVALKFFKFKFSLRRHKDVINIFEFLQKASKVLICAPEEPEAFNAFLHTLIRFKDSFPKAKITLFKNSSLPLTGYIPGSIKIIEYNNKQISVFGSAKKVLNGIQDRSFDVAIDANHSFQFVHTSLVMVSKAKLRVCFGHSKREDLYNFIIRLEPNQSYANSYNILLRYLGATSY